MTTIFYFSATGNSLKTAQDVCAFLGEGQCVAISKELLDTDCVCKSETIGIVFPVFAGDIPNMVNAFLKKAVFLPNAYIFAIGTCGGFTANSFATINSLLNGKLSYAKKLRMVANYIAMYDVQTQQAEKLLQNAQKRLEPILQDIRNRKITKIKKKSFLTGALFDKIRTLYPEADKQFTVNSNCNSCGMCVSVCPAQNIELKDGKPAFLHRCEHCMACVHWCPKEAINFTKKTIGRRRYHNPSITFNDIKLR